MEPQQIKSSLGKLDRDKTNRLLSVVKNPERFAELVDALTAAAVLSDRAYPLTGAIITLDYGVTRGELDRRLRFVLDWAMHRIADDKWAVQRVIDKCYDALADWIELGKERTESESSFWAAGKRDRGKR